MKRELEGEEILWAGRPSPLAAFWKSIPILLFGIPFFAFSLAWELLSLGIFFNTGVGKVEGPGGIMNYIFPIFGLPFVVVGFGLMGSPLWAARKATRTVHILTDRRLVTAVLGQKLSIKSIEPKQVFDMTRVEDANGFGTITFSLGTYRDSDGDKLERTEVWLGVADVRDLELKLRRVTSAAHPTGPDQPA
ncbi:MAG: hypothetical protein CFE31_05120 [Rhizobiales bacterium PAR1]|nr:MAG: hypothetical protein CFE31_05120 [Rhizobiales bacterium PAR1]